MPVRFPAASERGTCASGITAVFRRNSFWTRRLKALFTLALIKSLGGGRRNGLPRPVATAREVQKRRAAKITEELRLFL
jgi:hypothetical protein